MTACRIFHDATAEEIERLARALVAARVYPDAAALRAVHARDPWLVQVSDRGDVAVLDRWRDHLPLLAIEALWCPARFVSDAVVRAGDVARARGLRGLVSPPVPEMEVSVYEMAGMRVREMLVTLDLMVGEQKTPARTVDGVVSRPVTDADCAALLDLDAACFDPFWHYDLRLLERFCAAGALTVAERDRAPVGYTLCTVDGDTAVVGRLCVDPRERRRGIGAMLLDRVVECARSAGVRRLTLSTQAGNVPARALYDRMGFRPTGRRYGFLTLEVSGRGGPQP